MNDVGLVCWLIRDQRIPLKLTAPPYRYHLTIITNIKSIKTYLLKCIATLY